MVDPRHRLTEVLVAQIELEKATALFNSRMEDIQSRCEHKEVWEYTIKVPK